MPKNDGPTIQVETDFFVGNFLSTPDVNFYKKSLELAQKLHALTEGGVSVRFWSCTSCEVRWRGEKVFAIHSDRGKASEGLVHCHHRDASGMSVTTLLKWQDVWSSVVLPGVKYIISHQIKASLSVFGSIFGIDELDRYIVEIEESL